MRWIGRSEDGERVVLERFDGSFRPEEPPRTATGEPDPERIRRGAVVDVETTGTDPTADEVIELGLRLFDFDRRDGRLVGVGEGYGALRDPGRPIPEEVSLLTGIRDEDVRGCELDVVHARERLDAADLIVAHNARFDRPFVAEVLGGPLRKVWACSWADVNWLAKGFPSAKLELLTVYHGFFVGSHRALADVDGLLHLLSHRAPGDERTYLAELLEAARRRRYLLRAVGAPIEVKDRLKARGYRWRPEQRVWVREVDAEILDDERAWLRELAPETGGGEAQRIPPSSRFLDP